MTTDRGGIPVGPRAFDQATTRMAVARFAQSPLAAALATGMFRRHEPSKLHEFSRGLEAREVAKLRHGGDSARALDTSQRLERFDDGGEAPGVDGVVAFLFQTLEPCGLFVDGPDLCLTDELLRRGGTHHLREPPQVGWPPVRLAGGAASGAQQEGFEPARAVLEITQSLFPGAREVADGLVFHLGDIHGREITRAGQPSELHRIPTVGFAPIARFARKQCRGHDPTVVAFFHQMPIEPGTTGASLIDKDEMCRFGLHLAEALIDVALAGTDGPQVGALSSMVLSDIRHGDRIFVDIHADKECARL